MDTVGTRIHESGVQLAKQRDAFFSRTRSAGVIFVGETREAGRLLVGAVQSEVRRWQRFATQRAVTLGHDARAALSMPAFERTVLHQMEGTLRALDARVKARLAEIEGKPRKSAHKAAARKAGSRARKSRQTLPAMAA
jgi:hypothetical protein